MFPCLHRYWLSQFLKFFSIIQIIILVLFVFIDYLSRLDRFLSSEVTLGGALVYVLLKIPYMFVQLTPASILLSSIVVTGLMNRNNELLAIRSSGISIRFLVKPAIFAGLFFSLLMFFLGETIIPLTMSQSNYIKYNVIKKQKNLYSAKRDIWIKSDNKLIHINFYNPVKKTVGGIMISSMGRDFLLDYRMDANKGEYRNGKWVFKDVIEQVRAEGELNYQVEMSKKKQMKLSFKPEDLGEIAKKSEEMSFFELKDYVRKVQAEGYDATTYRVDLNAKIAFPFICIIMVVIGSVIGMKRLLKGNIPIAIFIGVVISFSYWVVYGFCLSLGYGYMMPSLLSAWFTNILFGILSTVFFLKTE